MEYPCASCALRDQVQHVIEWNPPSLNTMYCLVSHMQQLSFSFASVETAAHQLFKKKKNVCVFVAPHVKCLKLNTQSSPFPPQHVTNNPANDPDNAGAAWRCDD